MQEGMHGEIEEKIDWYLYHLCIKRLETVSITKDINLSLTWKEKKLENKFS